MASFDTLNYAKWDALDCSSDEEVKTVRARPSGAATIRSDGSKAYKEPKGGLFKYVTCANYACEIYQWIGFNVATQSAMGWFFVSCGAFQMYFWAIAKHKRLKKLFPGFKRAFKLLPPFV